MVIHYNLHRFGTDGDAAGRLINGDLPDDENERWNVIDAPTWRIEKLLAEHKLAQNTLRQCLDTRWEHQDVLEAVEKRLEENPHAMRTRRETAEHLSLLKTVN